MSLPVTIENNAIKMEVYPSLGGKVASIVDKADKFDLLFNYPAVLPQSAQYDIPFANSWHAGWDECFPAVAASRYIGHPYDGTAVPDHGELWGIPTTAVPTRDGITTVWHGLRFGYRLTRKLFLDGATIEAHYTLINLAPFEFRYVWAMHALMSLMIPVYLGADSSWMTMRLVNPQSSDQPRTIQWPTHGQVNFSKPLELPARKSWKLCSADPIAAPFTIDYPTRGRALTIDFSGEEDATPAHWGIFLNTGGWMGHHCFAIEPRIGLSDALDKSIKDGTAGSLPALGRREWSVRWALTER